MVSDSLSRTAPVASAPKDFPKKKRGNRSAKLKQCKLDARREQWLSQGVVKNKGESAGGQRPPCERKSAVENLETGGRGRGSGEEKLRGLIYHDFDSDSPANSPTGSSVLSSADAGNSFTGSSSSSSGGCCSGNITEEEEADDNCLDDWEAVADALAANDTNNQINKNDIQSDSSISSPELEACEEDSKLGEGQQTEQPKLAADNPRAWRSDDAFRPQSLPNLSKQRSLPNADRCFGKGGVGIPWSCLNAVPSSCPICCEELDVTDTSFLPCICGFRLCLFCYSRIRDVEDGRCPGCRKPYEDGGSLTFRLARSYSMVARS